MAYYFTNSMNLAFSLQDSYTLSTIMIQLLEYCVKAQKIFKLPYLSYMEIIKIKLQRVGATYNTWRKGGL